MSNKELELEACKIFVCPNLSEIDFICKELNLSSEIQDSCKNIAIEYLRKTYHLPRYTSIKPLIRVFVYIGANLNIYNNKRCINYPNKNVTQYDVCGNHRDNNITYITGSTMRKWMKDVLKELDIDKYN